MTSDMVLSARDVVKRYVSDGNVVEVLGGVSLDVARGEFVAVVGRSGSGKSTLLNVLSTLLSPDGGQVLLEGRAIDYGHEARINEIRRKAFSIIFQMHHLMPYLTALENVCLPFMRGVRPASGNEVERAKACLARVGLAHKMGSLPGRLSGGEQQRVAIARALVSRPKVLFADEPTGSLDKTTGEAIVGLLKELNSEGLTIVMVTHETDYARQASQVLTMEDGRIRV